MFRLAGRYSIGKFPLAEILRFFTFAIGEHIVFIYRIHISHSQREYIVFTSRYPLTDNLVSLIGTADETQIMIFSVDGEPYRAAVFES